MKEIKLGEKGRDLVTGFTGICVAESNFLIGCRRVGLTAEADKEGKIDDWKWFDAPQIEVIGEGVRKRFFKDKEEKPNVSEPGGPKPNASRPTTG